MILTYYVKILQYFSIQKFGILFILYKIVDFWLILAKKSLNQQ